MDNKLNNESKNTEINLSVLATYLKLHNLVSDVFWGKTKQGKSKLEFMYNNKHIIAMWFPKTMFNLYGDVEGKNLKDASEVIDILIKSDKVSENKSNYSLKEAKNTITLYHNTTNENAIKINKEGIIPGKRLAVYGKGSEAEGSGIWCSTVRGYGYGGATITFNIDLSDNALQKQNDTEYMIFRTIKPEEILDIDLQVSAITSAGPHNTMESDIPQIIDKHGKDKVLQIFKRYENKFIYPYNYELFLNLIETGNKYCRGTIKLNESNSNTFDKLSESKKLQEKSRNELLAKTKLQTKSRYDRASGYKGFSIADIDTTSVFTTNSLRVTCRVGNYWDTVEMEDILYWIQLEAEKNPKYQINTKGITAAIMNSIDGMDIKVDCNCADFCLEENTKIKLLNNEVVTVKKLKEKFDNNEELWVYSTDENGDFKPGKVKNVWISGKSNKMIKVVLDNGREIITTPEHRYMMRDGSYKQAKDLKSKDSLMPLYFSYHNGYECVKRNSKKSPTIFDSVYKIVADTVLEQEKYEAKSRTGEDIIQIHHKDFNKLNNYPSNLYPMGKIEHWMYHASLGGKNIDKLIEAGRKFWKEDPKRFEAAEKQRKAAKEYQINMWNNFTPEERAEYIAKSRNAVDNNKLSSSLKQVWSNYTEKERQKRLETNIFVTNNPMKDENYINSDAYLKRNEAISNKLKDFHKTTTSQQRSELYGWSKGKKQSKETIDKKINSLKEYHKNHPITEEDRKKLSDNGKKYAQKNKESRCLRNLNDLIIRGVELTPENFLANRKPGDAHYLKVFNSFEDMLLKLNIPSSYNHKVVSVEWIEYEESIPVYDIEVEKYHNFYVDAGVMLHNCYRFAYQATQGGYKYGKPENRPAKITNPHDYGALCKHLTSMLSNKKWLQQVSGTVMDFIVKRIDDVNKFLRPHPGEELTLPDELARQNAKKGFYTKLFKDKLEDEEQEDVNDDTNIQDNGDEFTELDDAENTNKENENEQ